MTVVKFKIYTGKFCIARYTQADGSYDALVYSTTPDLGDIVLLGHILLKDIVL
jgi:hypothetical protein